MLQPSNHLHILPLNPFQEIYIILILATSGLDAALQTEPYKDRVNAGRSKGIVLFCIGTASPWVQFWVPQYKDLKVLESTQRRAMKMGNSLESKMYEEHLRSLASFSPEQRRLGGGLRASCSSQGTEGQLWDLFSVPLNTWGNSMELNQGRVRLAIRKRSCTRSSQAWKGLLRAVGMAQSNQSSRGVLDNAPRHGIWFLGGPLLSYLD